MRARIGALLALCAVLACFVFAGKTLYEAARDAFVAPAILSPASDVVITEKLKLGELDVERTRAAAEMEAVEADLGAADQAIARLRELEKAGSDVVGWTSALADQKASSGAAELKALAEQKQIIGSMIDEQRKLEGEAEADVDAGLITGTDLARQQQALGQLKLALLENDRATLQSEASMQEALLAQDALSHRAPQTPELVERQEQAIRIELEILRLGSDQRGKLAQKRALAARLATLDRMAAELRAKPIFRAVDRNLDVAFVPYTQIDGVVPGAGVYACLWGLFMCKPVGVVSEIVDGEVTLPDPWGSPARGQYAVLDLQDHGSARAKVLRVRAWDGKARSPDKAEARASAR